MAVRSWNPGLLAGVLLFARPALPSPAPDTVICAGGPLYEAGGPALADLRGSGFTTVVAWTLHVSDRGDLAFNDRPLVAGGRYVGDPDWPARLAAFKRGGTVRRLRVAVGSAGVRDFHRIQTLLAEAGGGPDSPLRRSFQALLAAIPAIDGVDLDDEDLFDRATTVAFSRMLGGLGVQVTFCPYDHPAHWVDCLADLEAQAPGLVAALHLQCYDGGRDNRPEDWIRAVADRLGPGYDAAGRVRPGLWGRHGADCGDGAGPEAAAAAFAGWRPLGLRGGFIWLYDDLLRCAGRSPGPGTAAGYAAAVAGALAGRD